MKRTMLLLAALTAFATSCSDKMEVGHTVAPTLYFLHSGAQEVNITPENPDITVTVSKGGLDTEPYTVDLVVLDEDLTVFNADRKSAFRMLPGNCYNLSAWSVTLREVADHAEIRIAFDLALCPSGKRFVLPLRLYCPARPEIVPEEGAVTYLQLNFQ